MDFYHTKEHLEDLRKKTIELGKQVVAKNTTTQFPEWCLLKIGTNSILGYSFDKEFWENRIEHGIDESSDD